MKGKRVSSTLMCAALILTLLPAVTITAEAGEVCGDLTVTTDKSLGTDYTYAAHVLTFTSPGDYTVSMTTPGGGHGGGHGRRDGRNGGRSRQYHADRCAHRTRPDNRRLRLQHRLRRRRAAHALGQQHAPQRRHERGYRMSPNRVTHARRHRDAAGSWRVGEIGSNASGAGIGGSGDMSCGDVTIESGVIKAVGGELAAGIGGGGGGSSGGSGGEITITGGSVTALGGVGELGQPSNGCGAGIGGGTCSSGGTVNIIGGTVTAAGRRRRRQQQLCSGYRRRFQRQRRCGQHQRRHGHGNRRHRGCCGYRRRRRRWGLGHHQRWYGHGSRRRRGHRRRFQRYSRNDGHFGRVV